MFARIRRSFDSLRAEAKTHQPAKSEAGAGTPAAASDHGGGSGAAGDEAGGRAAAPPPVRDDEPNGEVAAPTPPGPVGAPESVRLFFRTNAEQSHAAEQQTAACPFARLSSMNSESSPPLSSIATSCIEARDLEAVIEHTNEAFVAATVEGRILMFNRAAEHIFGWSKDEVIGRHHINVLMPPDIAKAHDGYVKHYMETGENQVIGYGREVVGQRKNGTRFLCHLSVSEAERSNGEMIFVALIRDMENERLLNEVLPAHVVSALREGKPAPCDSFPHVTVLFSDIVGFTAMTSACSHDPTLIIDMLNALYEKFDELADGKYDLYKVETIGDAYMVAGGLFGDETGNLVRMADFALDMREAAAKVRNPVDGKPLRIRIGIHCGSVMAGVVGAVRPRWCLFGDTINVASRMESGSVPNGINTSEDFQKALNAACKDGFLWTSRGARAVKGKEKLRQWFLRGRNKHRRSDCPCGHSGRLEDGLTPRQRSFRRQCTAPAVLRAYDSLSRRRSTASAGGDPPGLADTADAEEEGGGL